MSESAKRILLVDDDASMVKVFSKYLEVEGFQVEVATDGQDAIDKVKQRHPDLIVLDIMLPKLNGYEVCAKLKRDDETKHIPVIMFTAKGAPQEHFVGLMFGADAYLSKSAERKELIDQVKDLLNSSASTG